MNSVLNKVLSEGETHYHERQQWSHTMPQKAVASSGARRKKAQSLTVDESKSSGGREVGGRHGEAGVAENTVGKLIESLDAEKGSQLACSL